MLLQHGRQIDFFGKRSRGIMQCGEQHMLLQRAGKRFDALQDASMKGVQKITVAQKKADHSGVVLENPAGLRIGPEAQAIDRFQHTRMCLPADMGTGIQHSRDCSDAYARGARYLPYSHPAWNSFQSDRCLLTASHSACLAHGLPTQSRGILSHTKYLGRCPGRIRPRSLAVAVRHESWVPLPRKLFRTKIPLLPSCLASNLTISAFE